MCIFSIPETLEIQIVIQALSKRISQTILPGTCMSIKYRLLLLVDMVQAPTLLLKLLLRIKSAPLAFSVLITLLLTITNTKRSEGLLACSKELKPSTSIIQEQRSFLKLIIALRFGIYVYLRKESGEMS